MKLSKKVGVSIAVLFAVLWAIPLARAVAFFRWAQGYSSADGSINASNDLRFSIWLLACYAASLSAGFAFAWIVARRPRLLLLLPGAFAVYAVGEVIWLRPETPIHLFPVMAPWRPALMTIAALATAALFIYIPRKSQN